MHIPGSNNGTWGYGLHRALFPKSLGGPFGSPWKQLPNSFQHPAMVRGFGQSYQLTPGGMTTQAGLNKYYFGSKRRRKSKKSRRKSKKSRRKSKKGRRKSKKSRRKSKKSRRKL
jgi:hypothetical protein